ncbi:hypothetical protein AB0I10_17190 [Streptomyces sp. NPDC050636]|uniref:hypothetical protein n=1 Tax=Streptomyces sp. NPDC050636 TaxID=3154510 RepID=UPI003422E7E1
MKYAKSAAVVVGSVIALGAAAPAFAVNSGGPKGLHGGVSDALSGPQLKGDEIHPLVATVNGAANAVKNEKEKLLGGATGASQQVSKKVAKKAAKQIADHFTKQAAKKAGKKVPLLGGRPVGK